MTLTELLDTTELTEWFRSEGRSHRLLSDLGWVGTTVPREYRHPAAPHYSIDLEQHDPNGRPFTVFHHNQRIARLRRPPSIDDLSRLANPATG